MSESVKSKYLKLNKGQIEVLGLFILFGIYLFLQHRLVGMYYDDFGNASLSYGYDSSAVNGTDYTLRDLLGWAKYTYLNWGGRIIYALMLIPLLKDGAHLFMMIQVVIMLAAFVMMYQIARKFCTNGNRSVIPCCFMLVYGLLQGDILSQGVYWASASVLYVWPILPLMFLIWFYSHLEEKLKHGETLKIQHYIVILIVVPFITLSQEQLGGALIVWLIFNAALKHWKDERRYIKLDCFTVVYAVVTYGIMFAAPGNWSRLSTNNDYVNKTLVERLQYGISNVLSLLTNPNLKYFNLLLLIAGILILASLWRVKSRWYLLGSGICMIPFLVADIFEIIRKNYISEEIRGLFFFIFLIDMLFLLIFYFGQRKQLEFVATMLAAVASVFCLIFSPAFSLRSCLPYVFICMIFIAVVLAESLEKYKYTVGQFVIGAGIAVLGIVCLINVSNIYKGYEKNYYIDNYNFSELENYNGEDDEIYLVEYDNALYRGTMSCDSGFEYIDYWVKEYFAIPQNVAIKWKSIPELMGYARDAAFDLQYEEGFYDDEGGYRWAENEAKLVINNKRQVGQSAHLSVRVNTGYSADAEFFILCNGKEIYQSNINNEGIECEIDIVLAAGENVIEFITDAEQIDTSNDARSLYMKFSNLQCEMVY